MTERIKTNRDPETLDVIDCLQRTSAQLSALMTLTTGASAENFRLLEVARQDLVLDLAGDLAERIREASGKL